jgi:hypothetical protein
MTGDTLETAPEDRWEEVPADPKPEDLGYEVSEWTAIETSSSADRIVLQSSNVEEIEGDEFIVVHESAICDLHTKL